MGASTLDIILTVIVLSFWFIFPIGMFLSVSHVDKNTDQIIRLGHLRHAPENAVPRSRRQEGRKIVARPHAVHFRRWIFRHH